MTGFWRHLRQSKLVQWAIAYMAGAFAALQGVDIVAQRFAWPAFIERALIIAIFIGFFVTLTLAWYHGERGAQRVTRSEWLLLSVLLAAGGVVLWIYGRAPPAPAATTTTSPAMVAAPGSIPAKSIAVLPFTNLSADKNNAYFADGMQDLILTKLADIGDLKVISRSSADKYASKPSDLRTVGLELGVATLLEGSVQKSGDQVLVNVQLIDARTDTHLWARSYQRKLDNVFGVEGEVAQKIATSLKARLTQQESRRIGNGLTDDPAVNDLFLRAEYYKHRAIGGSNSNLLTAIKLYRQALARMPGFTLARARLAISEIDLVSSGAAEKGKISQYLKDAYAQAKRAYAQAPDLVEAHIAQGYSLYSQGDYPAALKVMREALAIRPNDADTTGYIGEIYSQEGKFDKAIEMFRRAVTLDPRSMNRAGQLATSLLSARRYAEAEQAFRHVLAINPRSLRAKIFMAVAIAYGSGDMDRALAEVQGKAPNYGDVQVELYTYKRNYRRALDVLERLKRDGYGNWSMGPPVYREGKVYQMMGDSSRAKQAFAHALPKLQSRLQYVSLSSKAVRLSRLPTVLVHVARAELGIGETKAGMRDLGRALKVDAQNRNSFATGRLLVDVAATYAQAQRADLTVPLLSRMLKIPFWYPARMLWIDPAWDPIRTSPQFQALEHAYAKSRPAKLPAHA